MANDTQTTLANALMKVNAFIWLCAGGLIMSAITMMYNKEKYLSLWVITYLYGLLGFANNAGLQSYKKWRTVFSVVLLLLYLTAFLLVAADCGL